MKSATLELTQALIACRSVTPEDAGCLELICSQLRPLGFEIESVPSGPVSNVWARRGKAKPLLCFAGHIDVVPTGPLAQWTSDPFAPSIRDGVLYGRGASDMKSSCAAFVVAVREFLAAHPEPNGSIALLLTSDEEGVATDGTVKVVEKLRARGEAIDYCVVGEPTCAAKLGDTIKNGRRGSLSGRLIVKGVQGHVAYPHLAANAVHLVAPAIGEMAKTVWDNGNDFFPPTTWQVSNIRAGTGATNVIPGEAECLFNFRFSTASTVESLKQRTQEILDRNGVKYELEWEYAARPFLTGGGELVEAITAAIKDVTGIEPELSTTGGTSDGRFIVDICPQLIEFGPTNATIHKLNECIALDDLERLPRIYRGVLERLLVRG
ncbi:MAG TPA: succinyl-diaminopimelate desuccinylase [Burkholderiales bacterium]|nr:succinyl-diaminopimelate desuccinylase [Burkholderiales bacterium]